VNHLAASVLPNFRPLVNAQVGGQVGFFLTEQMSRNVRKKNSAASHERNRLEPLSLWPLSLDQALSGAFMVPTEPKKKRTKARKKRRKR